MGHNLYKSNDKRVVDPGVYEDWKFSAVRLRQGPTLKPNFDTTSISLLMPQNDPDEILYITDQTPHDMEIGSTLHPHAHFIQEGSDQPVFKLDIRLYDNGINSIPVFVTYTATEFYTTYVDGELVQIALFPDFDASHITGRSAILDFRFYRDDNVVSGDVKLKSVDFHYKKDRHGSFSEWM